MFRLLTKARPDGRQKRRPFLASTAALAVGLTLIGAPVAMADGSETSDPAPVSTEAQSSETPAPEVVQPEAEVSEEAPTAPAETTPEDPAQPGNAGVQLGTVAQAPAATDNASPAKAQASISSVTFPSENAVVGSNGKTWDIPITVGIGRPADLSRQARVIIDFRIQGSDGPWTMEASKLVHREASVAFQARNFTPGVYEARVRLTDIPGTLDTKTSTNTLNVYPRPVATFATLSPSAQTAPYGGTATLKFNGRAGNWNEWIGENSTAQVELTKDGAVLKTVDIDKSLDGNFSADLPGLEPGVYSAKLILNVPTDPGKPTQKITSTSSFNVSILAGLPGPTIDSAGFVDEYVMVNNAGLANSATVRGVVSNFNRATDSVVISFRLAGSDDEWSNSVKVVAVNATTGVFQGSPSPRIGPGVWEAKVEVLRKTKVVETKFTEAPLTVLEQPVVENINLAPTTVVVDPGAKGSAQFTAKIKGWDIEWVNYKGSVQLILVGSDGTYKNLGFLPRSTTGEFAYEVTDLAPGNSYHVQMVVRAPLGTTYTDSNEVFVMERSSLADVKFDPDAVVIPVGETATGHLTGKVQNFDPATQKVVVDLKRFSEVLQTAEATVNEDGTFSVDFSGLPPSGNANNVLIVKYTGDVRVVAKADPTVVLAKASAELQVTRAPAKLVSAVISPEAPYCTADLPITVSGVVEGFDNDTLRGNNNKVRVRVHRVTESGGGVEQNTILNEVGADGKFEVPLTISRPGTYRVVVFLMGHTVADQNEQTFTFTINNECPTLADVKFDPDTIVLPAGETATGHMTGKVENWDPATQKVVVDLKRFSTVVQTAEATVNEDGTFSVDFKDLPPSGAATSTNPTKYTGEVRVVQLDGTRVFATAKAGLQVTRAPAKLASAVISPGAPYCVADLPITISGVVEGFDNDILLGNNNKVRVRVHRVTETGGGLEQNTIVKEVGADGKFEVPLTIKSLGNYKVEVFLMGNTVADQNTQTFEFSVSEVCPTIEGAFDPAKVEVKKGESGSSSLKGTVTGWDARYQVGSIHFLKGEEVVDTLGLEVNEDGTFQVDYAELAVAEYKAVVVITDLDGNVMAELTAPLSVVQAADPVVPDDKDKDKDKDKETKPADKKGGLARTGAPILLAGLLGAAAIAGGAGIRRRSNR